MTWEKNDVTSEFLISFIYVNTLLYFKRDISFEMTLSSLLNSFVMGSKIYFLFKNYIRRAFDFFTIWSASKLEGSRQINTRLR